MQLIDKVDDDYILGIRDIIQKFHLSERSVRVDVKDSYELWEIQTPIIRVKGINHSWKAYYVILDNKVVAFSAYYIRPTYKDFPYKSATQLLIWKTDEFRVFSGFSRKIFWKYLLPNYHAVVTDSVQSPFGRDIWEIFLEDAFDKGYEIYLINTKTQKSKQLLNKEELFREFKDKYSTAANYKQWLFGVADPKFKIFNGVNLC